MLTDLSPPPPPSNVPSWYYNSTEFHNNWGFDKVKFITSRIHACSACSISIWSLLLNAFLFLTFNVAPSSRGLNLQISKDHEIFLDSIWRVHHQLYSVATASPSWTNFSVALEILKQSHQYAVEYLQKTSKAT